jgi:hypothetical protein
MEFLYECLDINEYFYKRINVFYDRQIIIYIDICGNSDGPIYCTDSSDWTVKDLIAYLNISSPDFNSNVSADIIMKTAIKDIYTVAPGLTCFMH